MPRKLQSSHDLTEAQRGRILSVFVRPFLFWMLLPGMLIALAVAFAIAELLWPTHFPTAPDWAFLVVISTLTPASGFMAGMLGFVLYMRRFLRYRSARHGRQRAIQDFVEPGDKMPWWRRVELSAYGIRSVEISAAARPQSEA